MPHSYPSPSEKHVLRRLKHLVLNDDFPNEESIPEETNGSLDTGKKRGKYSCEKVSIIEETNGSLDMGKKRGNYSCKECNVPLKGHVCPYRPVKRKPCYDRKKRQKIKTTDKNIQTTEEESFLVLIWKRQSTTKATVNGNNRSDL